MVQAIPSKLALATVADWCRDPRGYDPLAVVRAGPAGVRRRGARGARRAGEGRAAEVTWPALVEALEFGVDPADGAALLEPFV